MCVCVATACIVALEKKWWDWACMGTVCLWIYYFNGNAYLKQNSAGQLLKKEGKKEKQSTMGKYKRRSNWDEG